MASDGVGGSTLDVRLYLSFILFGLAQLLPWNVYLKSVPYFRMRMEDVPVAGWVSTCMASAYSLCNFGTTLVLVLLRWDEFVLGTPGRICIGITGNALLMLLMASVVMLSSLPPMTLFALTVTISALAGSVTAMLIKGLLGMAACFPPNLTPAMVAGQAVAGLLVSVASLFSALSNGGGDVSASSAGPVAYFVVGAVVLLLTLAIFCLNLRLSTRFQAHMGADAVPLEGEKKGHKDRRIPAAVTRAVFSRTKFLAIGLACSLAVTITFFSSFLTAPRRNAAEKLQHLYPAIIFIIYDVGDLIGRWLPAFRPLAGHPKSRVMLIAPYVRLLGYALLFVLLAPVSLGPRVDGGGGGTVSKPQGIDAIYALLVFSFGITNGYLVTLFLMHAPSVAISEHRLSIEASPIAPGGKTGLARTEESRMEREAGGTLMGLFLNIGLVTGSLSSFVWRFLL